MLIDFGREGRQRGEKHRHERNINWLCLLGDLTRGWTHSQGVCPDQESDPQAFGVWDNAPANWDTPARAANHFYFKIKKMINLTTVKIILWNGPVSAEIGAFFQKDSWSSLTAPPPRRLHPNT